MKQILIGEALVTQTPARRIRFKGRSFPVFTLEPEAPLDGWIEGLDALLAQSPAFFARKSIVIDLAKLELEPPQVADLVEKLSQRAIRVMGVSGVDPAWASDDLPPILASGRNTAEEDAEKEDGAESSGAESAAAASDPEKSVAQNLADAAEDGSSDKNAKSGSSTARPVAPLIIAEPIRSGQAIYYPGGDVTVVGSVASGAEIMAGGSVHIYGTLRGRVMAGAYGEKRARIFCRRLEAELISVCGVYLTADEIGANVQSQPIQAWLENETVKIARLD
jgi:septum site-determining protein MinC